MAFAPPRPDASSRSCAAPTSATRSSSSTRSTSSTKPAAPPLEALDPGAAFRDRYLDVAFDLSETLFVATATSLAAVPAMLRERIALVELPGYTEDEKRVIATEHLLRLQLDRHGLAAEQVQVTGEAVATLIRGYTREAGVWGLAAVLGAVCSKLVRRRAEGDLAPVEVTPQTVAGMLGAPDDPTTRPPAASGAPASPSAWAAPPPAAARSSSSKPAARPAQGR